MAEEFLQMGKRGTVVIPAKLRKRLGMTDGSLLLVSEVDGAVRLRVAKVLAADAPEAVVEVVGVETRVDEARQVLEAVRDLGEYFAAMEEVRRMGLDPDEVPHERNAG